MNALSPVAGVVLAGGRASRLGGGDKAEIALQGVRLVDRVIDRFRPQVDMLLINRRAGSDSFPGKSGGGAIVVPDSVAGFPGPLAGLVAAFEYLDSHSVAAGVVAMVPCDGPFLPLDLVARLRAAMAEQQVAICCIRYGGELQPTFSLWRRSSAAAVARQFREGQGGFKGLMASLPTAFIDWPEEPVNPFFNVNNPDDLALARRLIEKQS